MLEYFPDPHPDELLYSIWARYNDHVHFSAKTDALWELFGSRGVKPIIDLPCRIQSFVDRLPLGHCYNVDFFIDNHTLFPYYQAFLPKERRRLARDEMILGKGKGIHALVGIHTQRLPSTWFRFCPKCVEEDKRKFGECYWHRLHQLPGVEICPLHEVLIEKSIVRTGRRNNGLLYLISAEQALIDALPSRTSTFSNFDALLQIAQESAYFLEHPHLALDISMLNQKYRAILSLRGFLTARGSIREQELFKAFEEYYSQELLSFLQCNFRIAGERLRGQWLGRIFNQSESIRHLALLPLYHLLTIRFLGFTLKTILSQEIVPFAPFSTGPWPCLNPVCEHFQQRVISSFCIPDLNKKGIVVGRFSCQCGYTYSRSGPDSSPEDAFRKGSVLSYGPVWDAKFIELWRDSTVSKSKMGSILGITRNTLDSHARRLQLPIPRYATSSVTEEKIPQRMGKDREWYRQQWLTLVENSPGESTQVLTRKAKGVVSWLRLHDLEWFRENRPVRKKNTKKEVHSIQSQSGNQGGGIFKDRDALLAVAVRQVFNNLVLEQGPPKRVSKIRICQEIPELRRILITQEAPLTAQVLREVTETYEAFSLRRIDWALHQYMEERVSPTRWAFIKRVNLKRVIHHQNAERALDKAIDVLSQFA